MRDNREGVKLRQYRPNPLQTKFGRGQVSKQDNSGETQAAKERAVDGYYAEEEREALSLFRHWLDRSETTGACERRTVGCRAWKRGRAFQRIQGEPRTHHASRFTVFIAAAWIHARLIHGTASAIFRVCTAFRERVRAV